MIDGRALAEGEGWGPPFSVGEYGERVEKVRREMGRRGIDLMLVSSPPNITYLTGYDMIWYYLTSPVSVAVHAESGQTVFFEVPYHQPTVEWHAVVDDAEYFEDGKSPAESIVSALKGRGWVKGNVGVEEWSRAPSGVVINEIKQGLAGAGANVVDGSWVVDRVRLDQVCGGGRGDAEGSVHSGQGHGDGARTHSAGGDGNQSWQVSCCRR